MIDTQTLTNIYKTIDEIYNQGGKIALTNLLNDDIPEFFNSITFKTYCSNCKKNINHFRITTVTTYELKTFINNGCDLGSKISPRYGIVKFYEDQLICTSCYNKSVVIEKRAFDIEKEWMYNSNKIEQIANPTISAANTRLDYHPDYGKHYRKADIKNTPIQTIIKKSIKGFSAQDIAELKAIIIKYIDKILYNLN